MHSWIDVFTKNYTAMKGNALVFMTTKLLIEVGSEVEYRSDLAARSKPSAGAAASRSHADADDEADVVEDNVKKNDGSCTLS